MRLLDSFLQDLFTEKSFNSEFSLVSQSNGNALLTIPDATKKDQYAKWVETLPNVESPVWLGLPENAEMLLLIKKGQDILRKLLKLQTIEEDSSEAEDSAIDMGMGSDKRPAWMQSLRSSINVWIKGLPEKVSLLERTAESVKNPLFRFFEREIEIGSKLLNRVQTDLKELIQVCEGTTKQSNYTRSLMSNLSKGKKMKREKLIFNRNYSKRMEKISCSSFCFN